MSGDGRNKVVFGDRRTPARGGSPAEAVDRRYDKSARRKTASDRSPTVPLRPRKGIVPKVWKYVSLFVVGAMVLCAIGDGTVPPVLTIVAALIAIGLFSSARWLSQRIGVDHSNPGARHVMVATLVVLPLVLTSFAFGHWMKSGALGYTWGLGILLSMTAFTSALLGKRLVENFVAQASAWFFFAIIDGELATIVMVVAAAGLMGWSTRYQMSLVNSENERQGALERVRKRAEQILHDYEETGQGWFWETDRRGQITYISPSVLAALRKDGEEMVGRPFTDLFDLRNNNREGERTLNFHLSARSAFTELAVRANSTHEERWWSVNGRPVFDEYHNFCGFRGSGTDLTEKRKSAEHASRLAHFDSLTGLANRFQMAQSLEKILSAPLEMHRECAVFLLDLDRFKHVNDTLGHPAGDALLKQVAHRLERTVGRMGRVGRLGGDEFKVIIPGGTDRKALGALAAEIIASLSQPYTIEGHRVVIGASVGVALSPDDGETSEDIIRNADLALYAAKDGGRGRFHFYAAALHSKAEERSRLEQDLRDAIASNALQLHYQPVIHAATEKITGFEALLRWQHPVHGWMSPGKFIPVAEESGLIGPIGEWAIRQACTDLAQWPDEVRCAVNVSPLQFANPDLPSIVKSAIQAAGIRASRLELEITESVFLGDNENTDAMFGALKSVGVRLALDDFGTGYSSLGYLQKAPFDKIKIDQSFVRGATERNSRNGAIIASITSLAQALGMDTTAEGVETLDELDLVRMYGCSHVQGYIYERPLDIHAATERLRTGLAAIARGPRSARAPRHTMLRKVVLEHQGQFYNGTIRNLSQGGALVEGLWNVPAGTIFRIVLSDAQTVTATARWSAEDRMGVEFAAPLERDASGMFVALAADPVAPALMRKSA